MGWNGISNNLHPLQPPIITSIEKAGTFFDFYDESNLTHIESFYDFRFFTAKPDDFEGKLSWETRAFFFKLLIWKISICQSWVQPQMLFNYVWQESMKCYLSFAFPPAISMNIWPNSPSMWFTFTWCQWFWICFSSRSHIKRWMALFLFNWPCCWLEVK